jgi:hypothetical protein
MYRQALARGARVAAYQAVRPRDARTVARWPFAQTWSADAAQDQAPAGSWSRMVGARVTDNGLARWRDVEEVMAGTGAVDMGHVVYTDGTGSGYNWVSAGPSGYRRTDGTLGVALTGGVGVADISAITSVVFNGFPILNDPAVAPQYWALGANGNIIEPIPGWPGTAPVYDWQAFAFRSFREHLLALGMLESGVSLRDRLRWSDRAQSGTMPGTWAPAPDNLAGFIDLTGQKGDLVDGAQLGPDIFGLYKQEATYLLDYVGSPYVFRARVLSEISGLAGRNCVTDTPVGHVLFTGTDIVLNDGANIRTLIGGRLRRYLRDLIDPSLIEEVYALTHTVRKEAWFLVPIGGNDGKSEQGAFDLLAWDWERDEWSYRRLEAAAVNLDLGVVPPPQARPPTWDLDSESWDADPTPWNQVDTVTERTAVYADNVTGRYCAVDIGKGGDFGGGGASGFVQLVRYSWDCEAPGQRKRVCSFTPHWAETVGAGPAGAHWCARPSQRAGELVAALYHRHAGPGRAAPGHSERRGHYRAVHQYRTDRAAAGGLDAGGVQH